MRVGVVILSYNNHTDTRECVESFKKIKTTHEVALLVVDNSTEEKFYEENKAIKDIILLRQEENNGYASGNNIGLRYFVEAGYDYVVVINNDTIVEESFLDLLINEYDEKTGLVAPLIYTYPDTTKTWSSGGKYRKFIGRFKMNRNLPVKIQTNTFISGCCFLISTERIKEVGLLPEEYFMYNEDGEYSFRLTKLGYKLKVMPRSVIYHKESVTSGVRSDFQLYYIYRNNFLFIYRNHLGLIKRYLLLVNYLILFLTFLKNRKRIGLFKAIYKDRKKTGITFGGNVQ